MRLVYFASVRETIGVSEEQRDLPPHVLTIHEIVLWLADQSPDHASAFADTHRLRFALDQQIVDAGTLIGKSTELAIFPPVTGG